MITLENRFFPVRSAACFAVEGGIIFLSVFVSYFVLQGTAFVETLEIREVVVRGLVIAFFCQSCMYLLDLYDLSQTHSIGEIFFSLVFSVGFVCIGIALVSYILPRFSIAGWMYYLTVLFLAVFLLGWRLIFKYLIMKFTPTQKILIIGEGDVANIISREIAGRENLGFRLAGMISVRVDDSPPDGRTHMPSLNISQIEEFLRHNPIQKIVVAIMDRRGGYPVKELLQLRVQGLDIVEWPQFFEMLTGRIPINKLAPSYFIFNEGFRKFLLHRFVRRVTNFTFSLLGLVLFFPLMLITGVLILMESPGDVFYRQERVGYNGKTFLLFKFRSMRQDAESQTGPAWATENDSRVTRIGAWIRKFRIDELPQLINVLKGELDLIGPRPERKVFVEVLEKEIPYYSLRHTVRPGVTGWAQVMFPYCGSIEESRKKLEYDLYYVKNMSLKLDLLIMIRTVKIVLLGRGSR